jgi:hypothetical protein
LFVVERNETFSDIELPDLDLVLEHIFIFIRENLPSYYLAFIKQIIHLGFITVCYSKILNPLKR